MPTFSNPLTFQEMEVMVLDNAREHDLCEKACTFFLIGFTNSKDFYQSTQEFNPYRINLGVAEKVNSMGSNSFTVIFPTGNTVMLFTHPTE